MDTHCHMSTYYQMDTCHYESYHYEYLVPYGYLIL